MIGILYAFLGTLFTFAITSLGASNVFFVRKKPAGDVQKVFLGFAGGVMVAASIWSLLLPAIETAEENGQISYVVVPAGFLMGVGILLLFDRILRKRYEQMSLTKMEAGITKNTVMLILAITIHNIPEGMAVGLAFSLAVHNIGDTALMTGAICLAIGIGIQNYPEGAAVALPLVGEGISRKKAWFLGSMSAIVEPLFGVVAAAVAGILLPAFPILLSLAAGTMIYVVVEELIPQAHMSDKDTIGTLGFVVGFLLMLILDVALV